MEDINGIEEHGDGGNSYDSRVGGRNRITLKISHGMVSLTAFPMPTIGKLRAIVSDYWEGKDGYLHVHTCIN